MQKAPSDLLLAFASRGGKFHSITTFASSRTTSTSSANLLGGFDSSSRAGSLAESKESSPRRKKGGGLRGNRSAPQLFGGASKGGGGGGSAVFESLTRINSDVGRARGGGDRSVAEIQQRLLELQRERDQIDELKKQKREAGQLSEEQKLQNELLTADLKRLKEAKKELDENKEKLGEQLAAAETAVPPGA